MPTEPLTIESRDPEQLPSDTAHHNPAPSKPTILLVTSRCWFSAARVAMALNASGAKVVLLSPPRHPALLTRCIAAQYRFRALRPLRSLISAIIESRPDLIIPTDDIASIYLHQLYAKVQDIDAGRAPFIRSLLARSLGDPANFPVFESRTKLLDIAKQEGILTPLTELIPDKASLRAWLARNPLPAVLKADGTSGGEGVEIVTTAKRAHRAWRKLHAPLGLARAIKKAAVEHDARDVLLWFKRRHREVSIQPFIKGHDANIAVACWQGEVLGTIALDVLHSWRPKGPSALVELTHSDAMFAAVTTLVRRLRLSGLCGFDFMVEEADSSKPSDQPPRVWLIELNSRATQTCHLPYGVPRDLIASLIASLSERPLPAIDEARRRGIIALFPLAWQAGISKQALDSTLHDIPWEEPLLVKAGFAQPQESLYEKCKRLWSSNTTPRPIPGESK